MVKASDLKHNSKYNVSNDYVITYSFASALAQWNGQDVMNGQPYAAIDTATKKDLQNTGTFIYAAGRWAEYSVLSFSPLDANDPHNSVAELVLYQANTLQAPDGNTYGAYTKRENVSGDYSFAEIAIDDSNDVASPNPEQYWVMLHELGHALGLDGDKPLQNADSDYNTNMTVMSYEIPDYRYAKTPMALDILALEQMYGQKAFDPTDTYIYSANSSSIRDFTGAKLSKTIMDTGGTNTFDLSSYTGGSVTLDLRKSLDSQGIWSGYHSTVGEEYVFIAHNTTIQNAKGTVSGDEITGNDADNVIYAEGGDDFIFGSKGEDKIYGGTTGECANYGDIVDYSKVQAYIKVTALDVSNHDYKVEKWYVGSDPLNDPADDFDLLYSIENAPFRYVDPGSGQFDSATYGGTPVTGDENDNSLGANGTETGGITVSGLAGNDQLSGSGYNDSILGGAGNDYLDGMNGNDQLLGGAGADYLIGGDGDDYLDGGSGNDTLYGGTGDDWYVHSGGSDSFSEFSGGPDAIDTLQILNGVVFSDLTFSRNGDSTAVIIQISGGETLYLLDQNAGNGNIDKIVVADGTFDLQDIVVPVYGTGDAETLIGSYCSVSGNDISRAPSSINDLIYGGGGDDTISAYDGYNVVYGDDGQDTINGGRDSDILHGGNGNDTIYGYEGNDILYGDSGQDTIWGDFGADMIYGGSDNDNLYGDYGDDYLDGGTGDDNLQGGHGDDTYVYSGGDDTIFDYNDDPNDTIQFGDGLKYTDLIFSQDNLNLVIDLPSSSGGGSVTIQDYYYSGAYEIETLRFDDGSAVDLSSVI